MKIFGELIFISIMNEEFIPIPIISPDRRVVGSHKDFEESVRGYVPQVVFKNRFVRPDDLITLQRRSQIILMINEIYEEIV